MLSFASRTFHHTRSKILTEEGNSVVLKFDIDEGPVAVVDCLFGPRHFAEDSLRVEVKSLLEVPLYTTKVLFIGFGIE
jgi:hypothetical protein